MLRIWITLFLLLFAPAAQALVIDTNEFNNKTQAGWSYSNAEADLYPIITSPIGGSSPSGGTAITGRHVAGIKTSSTSGGTSAYDIPSQYNLTEIYYGYWVKYSSPFSWHPIATKQSFTVNRTPSAGNVGTSQDNMALTISGLTGTYMAATAQLWWNNCTYTPRPDWATQVCTRNYNQNKASMTFVPGTWYWVETYSKMNTVGNGLSSSHDGIYRVWVNDVLMMEHFDVVLRTNNSVFGLVKNTPILGGGGTWTLPQTQYVYYDHSVTSTTRIGMPGGIAPPPPPPDTTPPSAPTGLTATASSSQITVAWTAQGADNESGYASTNVLMCATPSCTPTSVLTTVSANAATPRQYLHINLPAGTTYSYRLEGVNGVGLKSTPTTTVTATTPSANVLYRTTEFTDDFNVSDNPTTINRTGKPWAGGYTDPVGGVIALSAPKVEAAGVVSATSSTQSLTIDATTKVLLACVGSGSYAGGGPSGVTFNGSAMTASQTDSWNGGVDFDAGNSAWYYMVNPTVTTANGVAAWSAAVKNQWGGAVTWIQLSGADTAALIDSSGGASFNTTGSALSASTTVVNDKAWVFSCAAGRASGGLTLDTSLGAVQVTRRGVGNDGFGVSYLAEVGTGARTMRWTQAYNERGSISLIAIKPAAAGGTATKQNFQILSQRAVPASVGDSAMTVVATSADHAITATLSVYTATNSYPGLLVGAGAGPDFNANACRVVSPGTTTQVERWVAGVMTPLVSVTSWSWVQTDRMRAEKEGNVIRCYAIRAGAETLVTSATDSTYASNVRVGLMTYGNPPTLAQFDDVVVETISSTPAVVPTISAFTVVGRTGVSGVATTGSPAFIRFFSEFSTVTVPIVGIVGGAYSWDNQFISGMTNYVCAIARTATGSEVVGGQRCAAVAAAPVADTVPPVLSNPQPLAAFSYPAGTTSAIIGFLADKPCNARYALTDIPYTSMTLTMSASGLQGSQVVTGLTDNTTTTYYMACGFENTSQVTIFNPTNAVATVVVSATPGDTTPPEEPIVVATARSSSQVELVIQPPANADGDIRGWRTYLSFGAGSTDYIYHGPEVPLADLSVIRTGLPADTVVNTIVRFVDTAENESANSNVQTVTTSAVLDLDPPTNASNLTVEVFTQSALLVWTLGVDNQGPVRSVIEQCTPWAGVAGVPCTNFASAAAPTIDNFSVRQLTPGIGYCWRVRTVDSAAAPNLSPGYSNTVCGVTPIVGKNSQRDAIRFGESRGDPDRGTVSRDERPAE